MSPAFGDASERVTTPSSPFVPVADGVRVRLKVTPRARRAGVTGLISDADGSPRLKVAVTAAASDGQANSAVLALLAGEWRIARSALSIHAGAADRRKTVAITGDADALMEALRRWYAVRGPGAQEAE